MKNCLITFFWPLVFWLLCSLCACQKASPKVAMSFYYWKHKLELNQAEWSHLQKLESKRLYVKFFDIDWNVGTKQAVPLASLQVPQSFAFPLPSIVPVVFITNRTLLNLPDAQLPLLAGRMTQKIQSLWSSLQADASIQEIQIDCDWTETTRAKYFQLLDLLEKEFDPLVQWSATIRLHQIKYFQQTGVPPVDRGMLMCYNTGDVRNQETENSILDITTLQSYLFNFEKYPLSLDLALPIFRWGVVFRDEKMIRLLNGLTPEALVDSTRFRPTAEGRYEVVKGTFLQSHYLYKGDHIRLEWVEPALLKASVQALKPHWPGNRFTLALYQLDSAALEGFPPATMEELKLGFEQ